MSKQFMNTTININTERKHNFKKAKKFTLLVLGISWAIGFTMHATLKNSNIIFKVIFELSLAVMPAIIAFILNKREGGNWASLRFIKPSFKSIILAILIPLIYVIVDFYLQIHLGIRTSPDWSVFGSTLKLFATLTVGFIVMVILVMGEEIGWRGYLQEKLFSAFGELKGVFLLGIIWGIWHLPIAINGYLFPNYPYIEAFVTYPLACIAFSLIIAYIGFNRYSIFIAAVLHAANNHFKASLIATTEVIDEFNYMLISNFICVDLILIFGLLYWKKLKTNTKNT
ncbi:type II CAAX endopeptidase family protein [Tenacibaculum sp. 190524A05c]|uniref:CPBP family intramembrane glutamic endopeptidase n=1 Tax=Tenacibaculum platacis TaxID=3137852 RepID=UPI0031FA71A5